MNRVLAVLAPIAAAWVAVAAFWPLAPYAMPFDDGFYYFEIAKNLAQGHGSTFDRLNPTNGYHPLWMALCVPFFWAGLDGDAAVRVIIAAQIVIWAVAVGLVGARALAWADAREAPVGPLASGTVLAALAAFAVDPFVVKTYANGLESAIYALAAALLLRWGDAAPWLDAGPRHRAVGAALLSFAFLCRTDAALLLPVLALFALPRLVRAPGPTTRASFELMLAPSVVIVAFMAVNELWYGAPMQVSGSLKRVPLTPLRAAWVAACLAAPWLVARAVGDGGRFPTLAATLRRTGWFGVFTLVLLAYYTGVQTYPRLWYFGPMVLYGLHLLLAAAIDLTAMAIADAPGKAPAAAVRPLRLLIVGPLAVGALVLGRQMFDPGHAAPLVANRDAGVWIGANLPPDAVLGCWDAGVLGYYAPQRIINLDGVVNSTEYAAAMRDAPAATAPLLLGAGLGWIVNHDKADGGEKTMAEDAAVLLGDDAIRGWRLVRTWPFSFSGNTNRDADTGDTAMAVWLFELPTRP